MEAQAKALFKEIRERFRSKRYSSHTEQVYLGWIRRFIRFHDNRDPAAMGPSEIRAFLRHLDRNLCASTSTQNQAYCALTFLYRDVLRKEPGRRSVQSMR